MLKSFRTTGVAAVTTAAVTTGSVSTTGVIGSTGSGSGSSVSTGSVGSTGSGTTGSVSSTTNFVTTNSQTGSVTTNTLVTTNAGTSSIQSENSEKSTGDKTGLIAGLTAAAIVIGAIIVVGVLVFFKKRKNRKPQTKLEQQEPKEKELKTLKAPNSGEDYVVIDTTPDKESVIIDLNFHPLIELGRPFHCRKIHKLNDRKVHKFHGYKVHIRKVHSCIRDESKFSEESRSHSSHHFRYNQEQNR